jgi:hypothetical protein
VQFNVILTDFGEGHAKKVPARVCSHAIYYNHQRWCLNGQNGTIKGEITRFVLVNAIHGIANLQIICKWSVVEAAHPTLPLKRYQRVYGWMGPNSPQILGGINGQQHREEVHLHIQSGAKHEGSDLVGICWHAHNNKNLV